MPVQNLPDPDFGHRLAPTAQRPLLGQTVLLVEDSRYASEAVRMLALRSGARIRRADCIASAERHLGTYRAGVAIVDLGLPDGDGLSLIRRLARATQRPTVLLATSGQDAADVEAAAIAAGADDFLPKPIESLAAFQQIILRHLPADLWPKGLRIVGNEEIRPDRLALTEDLAYAGRLLEEDGVELDFVTRFLTGLARTGRDQVLLAETESLANRTLEEVRPHLRRMIAERLAARQVI
ncbi:response regulator [Jannaschia pohangensis]|uniref:DNA-binding response regulator, OmpR family, contains REC and winged-helix (WHTH) domain n=1 Tax=Jannaschia pohangensis TaxID=390807 RepID=A0A1I3QH86_9RHOB|nr:response regulator [Jannaschia pohangensis]SFJ33140.1 DNA-binding response regulator, OmpR family, contains REC and winged-helix (wHTH) domain [Jannaschia pohangensis]